MLGFARVRIHHAVADEAVADLGDDAGLPDLLRRFQRRDENVWRRLRGMDDFEQRHYVGGAEEMQPDDVLGPFGDGGDLVDVEGRGVGADDMAPGRTIASSLAKISFFSAMFSNTASITRSAPATAA